MRFAYNLLLILSHKSKNNCPRLLKFSTKIKMTLLQIWQKFRKHLIVFGLYKERISYWKYPANLISSYLYTQLTVLKKIQKSFVMIFVFTCLNFEFWQKSLITRKIAIFLRKTSSNLELFIQLGYKHFLWLINLSHIRIHTYIGLNFHKDELNKLFFKRDLIWDEG